MLDYKTSGVDLLAADSIKSQIATIISSTYTPQVVTKGGEFAGVVRLGDSNEGIAVSIDGVGTKLKIAFLMNKHDTVGEDLVNHCVNDIAVIGCDPICFVDYISIGEVDQNTILEIVKGLARGCKNNKVSLIGGETAQMPDIYNEGEYDLAGAIIGKLTIDNQLPNSNMAEKDCLVAFRSNGIHTNGYSLARRIVFNVNKWTIDTYDKDLGHTWGEELLRVHRSYLEPLKNYRNHEGIRAFAHITGGGIPGNLSRIIPKNLRAVIHKSNIPDVPVFQILQKAGKVDEEEMFNVFNLGVGLIAVCSLTLAQEMINDSDNGSEVWMLGNIEHREQGSAVILA